MSHSAPRSGRPPVALLLAAAVLVAAVGLGVVALRPPAPGALPAPGVAAPVDAAGLSGAGYGATVAVLAAIYDAFARTDEAEMYDGLATVAAGDALEALYLERAGALARGGLPDQVVHELDLTGGSRTAPCGPTCGGPCWGRWATRSTPTCGATPTGRNWCWPRSRGRGG